MLLVERAHPSRSLVPARPVGHRVAECSKIVGELTTEPDARHRAQVRGTRHQQRKGGGVAHLPPDERDHVGELDESGGLPRPRAGVTPIVAVRRTGDQSLVTGEVIEEVGGVDDADDAEQGNAVDLGARQVGRVHIGRRIDDDRTPPRRIGRGVIENETLPMPAPAGRADDAPLGELSQALRISTTLWSAHSDDQNRTRIHIRHLGPLSAGRRRFDDRPAVSLAC